LTSFNNGPDPVSEDGGRRQSDPRPALEINGYCITDPQTETSQFIDCLKHRLIRQIIPSSDWSSALKRRSSHQRSNSRPLIARSRPQLDDKFAGLQRVTLAGKHPCNGHDRLHRRTVLGRQTIMQCKSLTFVLKKNTRQSAGKTARGAQCIAKGRSSTRIRCMHLLRGLPDRGCSTDLRAVQARHGEVMSRKKAIDKCNRATSYNSQSPFCDRRQSLEHQLQVTRDSHGIRCGRKVK